MGKQINVVSGLVFASRLLKVAVSVQHVTLLNSHVTFFSVFFCYHHFYDSTMTLFIHRSSLSIGSQATSLSNERFLSKNSQPIYFNTVQVLPERLAKGDTAFHSQLGLGGISSLYNILIYFIRYGMRQYRLSIYSSLIRYECI